MKRSDEIRVIIADDDKYWIEFLEQYLIMCGVLVVGVTTNGTEQIEMIKKLEADIIITDIERKNGISGLEVIKKCKEINIPSKFLITTAGLTPEKLIELHNMGIYNILFKPFKLKELLELIKRSRLEELKEIMMREKCENKRKNKILFRKNKI